MRLCLAAAGLAVGVSIGSAGAIGRDEALRLAYAGAEIRPERIFLTPEQQKQIASLSGVEPPAGLVARYLATRDGRVVGRAYLDTHVIRTKKESLLVSLNADGVLKRVDVTAFLEPAEYHPPDLWLRQYEAKALSDDLNLHRAIRPIAGATLTGQAINRAVRRVLAMDRVVEAPRSGGTRQ